MEEKVEKIWNDMFDKYISPSKYEKIHEIWDFHETWRGKIGNITTKEFIKKSLEEGLEVKSGWMATSIQGAHDFYILTRKNKYAGVDQLAGVICLRSIVVWVRIPTSVQNKWCSNGY